jgi:hypothetical protein
LFSASLEVEPPQPTALQLEEYATYWPALRRRAGQLSYNKKLTLYQSAQREVRQLWSTYGAASAWTPLDLEVVMVRPKWLCGTFAFHPMLGFRRDQQAASIAHGCATTLLELGRVANRDWLGAWGIHPVRLPPRPPASHELPILPGREGPGECHFRPGFACPFSAGEVARVDGLGSVTRDALTGIYQACGRPETHRPKEA